MGEVPRSIRGWGPFLSSFLLLIINDIAGVVGSRGRVDSCFWKAAVREVVQRKDSEGYAQMFHYLSTEEKREKRG